MGVPFAEGDGGLGDLDIYKIGTILWSTLT